MKSLFIAVAAAFLLSGCLGGSDSGSTPPAQVQPSQISYSDIAGIWEVKYTDEGETYEAVMVLTSDGKALLSDLDVAIYGTASVSNGRLTIQGYAYDGVVIPVTLTGTANPDRMELLGTSQVGNQSFVATRTQKEKSLYRQGANLAGLAGTYSDDPDFQGYSDVSGIAVIDTQGNLTFTAPSCTVMGKLSTINTAFNEYNVRFDTAGCTAAFTSGIYDGVAVKYENSQGKQGVFATGVMGNQEAVWFVGVK
ncbi:MAG: hypothetical protein IBX50_14000 [Marinospirillum sp.]|uniref:hypothetical protein n=1 Tax=Marinospirillum sp. TaxID=2183934 RepID=UPI001A04B0EC|nr:hypothetical protein [Marinospirillum sp.]MBE0507800.1 hypothetical protein [Marinospirillum sp.]